MRGLTGWRWTRTKRRLCCVVLYDICIFCNSAQINSRWKSMYETERRLVVKLGCSLLVCVRPLLIFALVLLVARPANFSSGLILAVEPQTTGRIHPALHARRPRGRGDVKLVLPVARLAQFSSGLIFAAVPLNGRIRPARHARRPRGRSDVQSVLLVARLAHFSSGLVFAACAGWRRGGDNSKY